MSKTSIDWQPGAGLMDCRTSGATMGTRYAARFVAPAGTDVPAIERALATAVTAVDQQMSNWTPESDLSRLNRTAPGVWTPVPVNLAAVLTRALEIGCTTDNAFNIGVGDLVDAWGFGPGRAQHTAGAPRPRPRVDTLLEVDLAGGRARRHADVALDLCGIAKGFGVDELARVLDGFGIGSWLVGIDGELRARGAKADGSAWAIALEAPCADRRDAMAVVELGDAAIATSGDYRHGYERDGERIAHTMDPRTGAPARGGLAAVTVIAPRCVDADAYATALMVLGAGAGVDCARRLGLDALFVQRGQAGLKAFGTGLFGDA